jgi:hypothetical protein
MWPKLWQNFKWPPSKGITYFYIKSAKNSEATSIHDDIAIGKAYFYSLKESSKVFATPGTYWTSYVARHVITLQIYHKMNNIEAKKYNPISGSIPKFSKCLLLVGVLEPYTQSSK